MTATTGVNSTAKDLADRVRELEDKDRRRRLRSRLMVGLMLVAAISAPIGVSGLGPVPHTFSAGGVVSAGQMNANFAYLQDAITALEGQVPIGTVAFFDLDACPAGWTEHAAAQGRTIVGVPSGGVRGTAVGERLGDAGLRTISEVPAHDHLLTGTGTVESTPDPGHSHTASPGGGHAHTGSTAGAGAHVHGLGFSRAGDGWTSTTDSVATGSSGDSPRATPAVGSAGDHSHAVTVATGGSHGHAIEASAPHTHLVDLAGLEASATGVASVDVTMPYVQLLACRRN